MALKTQGFLNSTRNYLRLLQTQGVSLPDYSTLIGWDNFMRYTRSALFPRNLAAYYNIQDLGSLIYDGSNRVMLIGDQSGNSATNCLVTGPGGAVTNGATTPDSAANSPTTDMRFIVDISHPTWTAASNQTVAAKWNTGGANSRSFVLRLSSTNTFDFIVNYDGTGTGSISASAPTAGFVGRKQFRCTRINSTGATTIEVWTGSAWSIIASNPLLPGSGIFNSTSSFEIGQLNASESWGGTIFSVIIETTLGTTSQVFNPSTAAKLATSFVSTTGETWTINSTGDLGARICGERDLVQFTTNKMPILTISSSGNYLTFDGVNDYMKAASFALSQPESVYFAGNQITWSLSDKFFDGDSLTTPGRMTLLDASAGSSPQVVAIAGGTEIGPINLPLGTNAIVTAVFNSTASQIRLNRATAIIGDAGTSNGNGFTLAATAGGGSNYGNIAVSEIAIYSEAHNAAIQNRIIGNLIARYNIRG